MRDRRESGCFVDACSPQGFTISSNMPTLLDLPNELLSNILSSLPSNRFGTL